MANAVLGQDGVLKKINGIAEEFSDYQKLCDKMAITRNGPNAALIRARTGKSDGENQVAFLKGVYVRRAAMPYGSE